MRRKKNPKKPAKKSNLTGSKLLFLSVLLLFIVFEALYLIKGQQDLAQRGVLRNVAGVSTSK